MTAPVPQAAVDAALAHESDGLISSRDQWVGCICGERLPCRFVDRDPDWEDEHRVRSEHVAAAVVAAVQGPIKAEALREAAVDVQAVTSGYPNNPRIRSLASIRSWLRARADRIEAQP